MINPIVFSSLAANTVGLRTAYPICDAGVILEAFPGDLCPDGFGPGAATFPLTYLDSTASTKMIGPVRETLDRALLHYANSHSTAHGPARVSTYAFDRAHETILRFVNAREDQAAVFVGSGTTGAINRLARTLFGGGGVNDGRDTVIFTGMEHHANILPWLTLAPRAVAVPANGMTGRVPLDHLAAALQENRGRVRLVAATGISNVTGIVNDIASLAALAHGAGAEILIDAAQTAAHKRIDMKRDGVDYLVFSGHKVYAPLSPGVLVMPKSASPEVPDETGGGIVLSVNLDSFLLTNEMPAREEAGTPNVIGAILLASALKTLNDVGMDNVWEHELSLTKQMVDGLSVYDEVRLYGDTDLSRTPRAGVVTFSIDGVHHAIVARALSDYFGVAVRNECFCAHPYVKALLGMSAADIESFENDLRLGDHRNTPGMVRASLGVYNGEDDIARFHHAVDWVVSNRGRLNKEYTVGRDGTAGRDDGWHIDPTEFPL